MSERRVEVPEGMRLAAKEALVSSAPEEYARRGASLICCEAALQWLVANPQVPTDEQCDRIAAETWAPNPEVIRNIVKIYTRRFLFAPAEPEEPLADLKIKSEADFTVSPEFFNGRVAEAFLRGQQSMITKEKQP